MRVLGFSEMWPKLEQPSFTTFRFPRKDADWAVGEVVQIVYKPRSKERKVLGIAEIVGKDLRWGTIGPHFFGGIPQISSQEAITDGFPNYEAMYLWLRDQYPPGDRLYAEPMQKLTLEWREKAT